MLQNFLAGFGGVGGACALITLLLKLWPGALDTLATGLYAHVQPKRLPYDSPLSQHFAKTRMLDAPRNSTTVWTSCAGTRSKTRSSA